MPSMVLVTLADIAMCACLASSVRPPVSDTFYTVPTRCQACLLKANTGLLGEGQ